MNSLLSMEYLSVQDIMRIINRAIEMKNGSFEPFEQKKYIANLFFENSTRTKLSFEMAEKKLGIETIPFHAETSSVSKGESLYDTCKTLESIGCDALVIRHTQNEYYKALGNLNIPIINGGDGSGSHPTQCLLDLMTIYEKFGTFKDLNILIAGDISHSRVAKSNFQALTKLGAKVQLVAPDDMKEQNEKYQYVNIDEVIEDIDVLMLLRVQHERHYTRASFTKEEYNASYGLNDERYEKMKDKSIIMHPAPVNRDVEIKGHLIESEKSVIFEQMANGVFVRMSILENILKENE